ncbi:rRNA pseudouridine synthase [Patescibacteria group bacterium]|nr:rRNA pseudouridine synthase [Patescibacteria group bacterium]MCG2694893.1 rRNA pseudouridine synthase [Candidatus Parcubacteria bacterium]
MEYPIRINRYLLLKGFCSRREADRLIEKKQVKINGKIAEIGQKVEKEDKVEVGKKFEEIAQNRVYLAFNKPIGVVTHDPIEGQTSIDDILKYETKVFPLGRLDKNSHGLIILTNDGRITNPLLNPELEHEKEYVVEVNHRIDLNFIREMEKGVSIDGYKTKPTKIKKVDPRKFHIILTEGKKHQIRRMCSALKQEITDLERIRIMNINLGKVKTGEFREIKGEELKKFLKQLNVN